MGCPVPTILAYRYATASGKSLLIHSGGNGSNEPRNWPQAIENDVESALKFRNAKRLQQKLRTRRGAASIDGYFSNLLGEDLPSDKESIHLIGEVCRRLDGVPLALDLAAARASVFGIGWLAANLHDRFRILTGERRTAPPRHQTFEANLDWSYQLLDKVERKVLRWLGMFVNGFTINTVCLFLARAGFTRLQALDAVSGLVSKSLLTLEQDGPAHRYRLLETTRAYALQRLDDNGERVNMACMHAALFRVLFDRTQDDWSEEPTVERLSEFRREHRNLRVTLD